MPRRMREVQDFNTQLNALGLTTVYDMGYLDGPYEPLERLLKNNDLTVRVYYPLQYYIRTPKEVPRVLDMIRSEKPLSRNHWLGVLGMGEHVYGPVHDSEATWAKPTLSTPTAWTPPSAPPSPSRPTSPPTT